MTSSGAPPRTFSARPTSADRDGDFRGFYAWTGETHPVSPGMLRIAVGRIDGGGPGRLDVALRDREISSVHCLIERRADGRFALHDCSKNGTLVNGVRVHKASIEFQSGDTLQLGQTKLVVLREGGPDFGPPPHGDEVILAAFRYYKSMRATAEGIEGVSFHRVRALIQDGR